VIAHIVDGSLALTCCCVVVQDQAMGVFSSMDWQLKLGLIILTMQSLVSGILLMSLEKIRLRIASDGGVIFPGASPGGGSCAIMGTCVAAQVISVAIVAPCLHTIIRYAYQTAGIVTTHLLIVHVAMPAVICVSEILLAFIAISLYITIWIRTRNDENETEHDENETLRSHKGGYSSRKDGYIPV